MSLSKEVIYETNTFPYKTIYVCTYDDIERRSKEILDGTEKFLGFDTEMADSRSNMEYLVKGTGDISFMPTLMVQLCTSSTVYLFHLYEIYIEWRKTNELKFPPSLKKILSSEIIVKVGFTTHNDTLALYKTYGINVSKIFDIDSFATSINTGFSSLKDLVTISELPYQLKGKDEPHDWTNNLTFPVMRKLDIEYAALDAIVCLELHTKLVKPLDSPEPGTKQSDDSITKWLKVKRTTKRGEELSRYIATAFPPWQRILSLQKRTEYAKDYVNRFVTIESTC